jgi:hypothetical protein
VPGNGGTWVHNFATVFAEVSRIKKDFLLQSIEKKNGASFDRRICLRDLSCRQLSPLDVEHIGVIERLVVLLIAFVVLQHWRNM